SAALQLSGKAVEHRRIKRVEQVASYQRYCARRDHLSRPPRRADIADLFRNCENGAAFGGINRRTGREGARNCGDRDADGVSNLFCGRLHDTSLKFFHIGDENLHRRYSTISLRAKGRPLMTVTYLKRGKPEAERSADDSKVRTTVEDVLKDIEA